MRKTPSRFGPLTRRWILYYPALAASATALTRAATARPGPSRVSPNARLVMAAGVVARASRLPTGRLALEPTTAGETPDAAGGTPAPLLSLLLPVLTLFAALNACTGAEPGGKAAPEWDALFQRESGWIGADGDYSIPLKADTTLWLFSDTFVGKVKDGKRLDAVMINNSIALQRGTN